MNTLPPYNLQRAVTGLARIDLVLSDLKSSIFKIVTVHVGLRSLYQNIDNEDFHLSRDPSICVRASIDGILSTCHSAIVTNKTQLKRSINRARKRNVVCLLFSNKSAISNSVVRNIARHVCISK